MTTHAGENADSLQPGDPRELGPYRLLARLGRGGMGTVFLGEEQSGRRVAVKVINRELAGEAAFRERFRREVTAARQVRRFCTAPVIDAELGREPLYIITEFIEGPSLDRAVAERGPLPGSDLEGLAVGVATALAAIHGAGIVHRDLKPANVLLSSTGPRVIDFGIARALDMEGAGEAGGGPTRTGQFIGTPNYLPPELLRGEPVTPASDVFSWGCVVAYAGTGRAPFGGNTVPEIFYKVAHEPPVLDGIDPGLRELVAAALSKDPRSRPTTQELLGRLVGTPQPDPAMVAETVQNTWHGTPPTRAMGPQPMGPQPGWQAAPPPPSGGKSALDRIPGGRKTLGIAAAALAVVVLGAIALFALSGSDGPPTKVTSVFSDDFSSNSSGWAGGTYSSSYGYQNGKYRTETNSVYGTVFPDVPKKEAFPERLLLSVDAEPSGPGLDSSFGAYCRSLGGKNTGYAFLVRLDGKGALLRKEFEGGSKELTTVNKVPGFAKEGPQKVQIACEQQDKGKKVRLGLWVGGEQVLSYTDTDKPLVNGKPGVIIRRGGNEAQNIRTDFDNIDVSEITG